MKRAIAAVGITLAAALTPLAGTSAAPEPAPTGGGWTTFANCFAQTVPGGRPMCAIRGTNREPSRRLRYKVTSATALDTTIRQTIRCFYTNGNGVVKGQTTTSRVRLVDLDAGEYVFAFRPYLVDTANGERRAQFCSVTVNAEPVRGHGEMSVFMEAAS